MRKRSTIRLTPTAVEALSGLLHRLQATDLTQLECERVQALHRRLTTWRPTRKGQRLSLTLTRSAALLYRTLLARLRQQPRQAGDRGHGRLQPGSVEDFLRRLAACLHRIEAAGASRDCNQVHIPSRSYPSP